MVKNTDYDLITCTSPASCYFLSKCSPQHPVLFSNNLHLPFSFNETEQFSHPNKNKRQILIFRF